MDFFTANNRYNGYESPTQTLRGLGLRCFGVGLLQFVYLHMYMCTWALCIDVISTNMSDSGPGRSGSHVAQGLLHFIRNYPSQKRTGVAAAPHHHHFTSKANIKLHSLQSHM